MALGDDLARHIDGIEARIRRVGTWGPVGFVLLYVGLSSIFVPDTLLGIVAGATFGFAEAVATVVAGTVLGAALQYALSRRLLTPVIDSWLLSRPALAAIQGAVRQQEFKLQVLIRLTPINRALTSYVLGAAGVGFARFLAACVALVPSLCLEVYMGYAGKHLVKQTGGGHGVAVHDVVLCVGLATAFTAMVTVSRTARKAVEAAIGSAPKSSPGQCAQ